MKLFKKALLATAVMGAMGAQAATISSANVLEMSKEGVAAGKTDNTKAISFDVIVDKQHAAASNITLTFDSKVDISALTINASVDNSTTPGQGDAGDLDFDYGNGNFTFDNVVVNTKTAGAHTISFDVNLGNPVDAKSAFRVTLAAGVVLKGASSVSYASVEADGTTQIETGTGAISKEVNQFGFTVDSKLSKLIDRTKQYEFTTAVVDEDAAVFDLVNNESLAANLSVTSVAIDLAGNFKGVVAADLAGTVTATKGTAPLATAPAVNGDEDEVTITVAAAELRTDGKDEVLTFDFDKSTASTVVIPQTGSVKATATFSATGVSDVVVASAVDAGAWALDAAIINVPYLPVGFDGLSTSIHFANENSKAVDVIVTAIDTDGEKHEGTIADLAANTVTKVSQGAIMTALGLDSTMSYKLSATFNIDADVGTVNAYAFSTTGDARQALVTSQQKGSDK